MFISIVVPAFNEGAYLGKTLANLNQAKAYLQSENNIQAEIIVVDNDSSDSTAAVARAMGATVAREELHNVARVRNTGAILSSGDVIVFVDADTLVPENLLSRIVDEMSDETCLGGAVDTDYRPAKTMIRIYLGLWRMLGKLVGMAQGATQFCRREVYTSLSGYDESLYMGEDVDFHWRMKQCAKRQNARVCLIENVHVVPSTRRFDQWPFWRTLVWTNPLFVLAFRRKPGTWRRWYTVVPR